LLLFGRQNQILHKRVESGFFYWFPQKAFWGICMQIKRVINNNIVSAMDGDTEVVVSGRGIGFGHREGDSIDPKKIEKIYRMEDSERLSKFKDLLAKVPLEHLNITDQIITMAKKELGPDINENIYVTLTDHISFALERYDKGMMFENALTHEVRSFYPAEFRIGEKAVELIASSTGKYLGEDEAASIALHLVSAQLSERTSVAFEITQAVKTIFKILSEVTDEKDPDIRGRLDDMIPTFKHLVYRVISGQQYSGEDTLLYEFATGTYPQETQVCGQIVAYLEEHFQKTIKKDECSYIIILLRKLNLSGQNR